MVTHIAVRTLGTVAIDIGQRRIGPSSGRLFALLLYLATRRGHPVSRRVVQDLLFPSASNVQAAHNLRQLLYRLRQLGAPIEADSNQIQLAVDQFSVDCYEIADATGLKTSDVELLTQGVFPGYNPDISESYRDWFEAERSDITLRLSRAVGAQLLELRRVGRWDLMAGAARALLALDPLSEEGTLAKAEALAISGSKTAALSIIDEYLKEIGENEPQLRVVPTALKRRISERLPESNQRLQDDRLFLGREESMRLMSGLGTEARSGRQEILLIWGEPGVGKTRLLTEFRSLSAMQGGITRFLSCQPHDLFRPLGILCDLVSELLQSPGALGCDTAAREVLERLANTRSDFGASLEDMAVEVPVSTIVRCVIDLVGAVTSECPVVVLIDDVQWLDAASVRALLGVFDSHPGARTYLILASRSRTVLADVDKYSNSLRSVRLEPLGSQPALELVRNLLGKTLQINAGSVESRVVQQAKGNPFFIRLLCSHFVSTMDPESLGQTLTEILERRLEQLSPDATRVLEACVILGKNCTCARLEGLLELPRHNVLRALEELDDRALVQIDGCFLRSHDLLTEAVQKRMSKFVYRAVNAAAANLLQSEWNPAGTGSLPWDCAEHWRLAGEDAKAVAALRNCARQSLEIGRSSDALATLKRALCFSTPDSTRAQIIEDALGALLLCINWSEGSKLLYELKQIRSRLGRRHWRHDKFELLELSLAMHADGDPRVNIHRLSKCLTTQHATLGHRLFAARHLIMIAELTLDRGLAEFAFQSISRLPTDRYWLPFSEMLYHTVFGDSNLVPGLIEKLEPVDDLPQLLVVLLNIGYAQYRVARSSDAERTLLRVVETAQRFEIDSAEMHGALLLARLHWSLGQVEQSQEWHRQFSELLSRNADTNVLWEHRILGARIATRAGRIDEAREYISLARRCKHCELELPQLLLMGCESDLRIAAGEEPCDDTELDRFVSLHLRARNLGLQDEATLSLLHALQLRGQTSRAARLYDGYMGAARRDGFAVRNDLADWARRFVDSDSHEGESHAASSSLANSPF
ncbi:MAG TPA: AAA family ATPase [Gemmatimonadaceae bacterium]